jgi:hypothetical protein
MRDPVVALIDHGSEINLMSKDLYQKGKWPFTKDHGWKIRATIMTTEHLFTTCLSVQVEIGDIEIDQNFYVQEDVSHSVILGQPFIMASRMEANVLDSGAPFAKI